MFYIMCSGDNTSALYIENMNEHCSLSTAPCNPHNGIGVLAEYMLPYMYCFLFANECAIFYCCQISRSSVYILDTSDGLLL